MVTCCPEFPCVSPIETDAPEPPSPRLIVTCSGEVDEVFPSWMLITSSGVADPFEALPPDAPPMFRPAKFGPAKFGPAMLAPPRLMMISGPAAPVLVDGPRLMVEGGTF